MAGAYKLDEFGSKPNDVGSIPTRSLPQVMQLWRLVRPAQDVGKPGDPPAWDAGERRFKSDHPDWLLWSYRTTS